MNTIVVIVLVLLAVAGFVAYRLNSVHQAGRVQLQRRFKRIQSLYDKITNEEPLTRADVLPYAKNILTREATFNLLKDRNMTELFPPEFYSHEQAGASYLANWLELPSELDACPDEIQYVKRVVIQDQDQSPTYYEVFKYRINPPHPSADNGWMIGIAGPCYEPADPYDQPRTAFNRANRKFDSVIPEEEAKWVHEHVTNQKD
jgi:hypothetical protein